MNQKRITATGKSEWSKGEIQRILKNEKYVGDALLQKTFTVDCITHKVVKNNGERPMYLVSDHHAPIIDRDTFNRVQQEIARRSSKRKISDIPKHLLSHLEGNIAWKNPEQAIAQRERLRQERIAAREQRAEPVSEIRELNENVPDEISSRQRANVRALKKIKI